MSISVGELREKWRNGARRDGINPRDVDLLLADALGRPVTWLITHDRDPVDEDAAARFDQSVERRFGGEPLQYIRGHCEFFGRDFLVDDRVLIPRPETEFLVDAAVKHVPRDGRVVDVGTGSGCIAVSMALERRDVHVSAVDASVEALAVARRNAARNDARITFTASDLLSSLRGEFDAIVSNPPYVPAGDVATLSREVRDYEPRAALTPGAEGFEIIERLLTDSQRLLRDGGLLMMEIGFNQSEHVSHLARHFGWSEVELIDDLAGIPRIVVLSATAETGRERADGESE